jgi:N-formylglutamate amidohydrolase
LNELDHYIDHHQGTIPLVISVSHGGVKKIEEIPDRTNGILGIDKKTINLAQELIENIENLYSVLNGKIEYPSYVISKIHRSKIDLNRPKSKAFEKSKLAESIYDYYHRKISEFITFNLRYFNWSLLIDVHGFEKDKRPEGYRDVELILGSNNMKSMYSIPPPKKFWKKSFRGKIIKKFNKLNIPIAPGSHLRKEYVLTGGFITTQYGASKIPNSQTLQIEFSDRIRIYDDDLKRLILKTLAQLVYEEIVESRNII